MRFKLQKNFEIPKLSSKKLTNLFNIAYNINNTDSKSLVESRKQLELLYELISDKLKMPIDKVPFLLFIKEKYSKLFSSGFKFNDVVIDSKFSGTSYSYEYNHCNSEMQLELFLLDIINRNKESFNINFINSLENMGDK